MYTVVKDYRFSSAHRLEGHPKCGRMHGHNYLLRVVFQSMHLTDGMVIDFNDVGRIVEAAVGEMDHRYIVSLENVERCPYVKAAPAEDLFFLNASRSTAEEMAAWICRQVEAELIRLGMYPSIAVEQVILWETIKSQATFKPY